MRKIIAEEKVRIYLLVMLVLSLFYYMISIKNNSFQAVAFGSMYDTFMDWFNCVAGYGGNPYAGEVGTNYPALAVLFFRICRLGIPEYALSAGDIRSGGGLFGCQNAWIIFGIYNGILVWIFSISVDCRLKLKYWDRMLFLAVCLFSFPVLFAFERGNIINLAFVLTFFFCSFYDDENKVLKELSFFALAIAAGIKIYPAIFGLLLLKRRKIKECIRLTIYGIISFVCPFFVYGGKAAILSFVRGILSFATNRSVISEKIVASTVTSQIETPTVTIMPASYGYNFSFSNICKVFQEMIGRHVSDSWIDIVLVISCVMLFVTAFMVKEKWKELCCYTLVMILVPSFSGAYVMLFMLIPFMEYLNWKIEKDECVDDKKLNYIYALLFLLLMTPLVSTNVSAFDTNIQPGPFTWSYFCYFMCVLIMMILMVCEGIKNLVSRFALWMKSEPIRSA